MIYFPILAGKEILFYYNVAMFFAFGANTILYFFACHILAAAFRHVEYIIQIGFFNLNLTSERNHDRFLLIKMPPRRGEVIVLFPLSEFVPHFKIAVVFHFPIISPLGERRSGGDFLIPDIEAVFVMLIIPHKLIFHRHIPKVHTIPPHGGKKINGR